MSPASPRSRASTLGSELRRSRLGRGFLLAAAAGLGAAGTLFSSACQSAHQVSYTGRELAPVSERDQVALIAGTTPPEGYSIIGVVTAACATIGGATGLLEDECSEEILIERARERGAQAGATALLDLSCRLRETERSSERDAGVVTLTVRQTLTCQGTALRHEGRRPAAVVAATPERRLTIAGVEIAIAEVLAPAPAFAPRPAEEVAEMERFPSGHARLGRISATCLSGCARNTARRAIREEAARLGALAFAELECDLDDDRWRCAALLVGPSREPDESAPGVE